ncbi:hypothetical protein JCM16408A_18490 [Methylobacterium phyllosphaerae]
MAFSKAVCCEDRLNSLSDPESTLKRHHFGLALPSLPSLDCMRTATRGKPQHTVGAAKAFNCATDGTSSLVTRSVSISGPPALWGNYPRPCQRRLGGDGVEDCYEASGAGQACSVEDGADGGFSFGGPHGAVAVGDLPLHDSRTQEPLEAVVGRLDLAWIGVEDQELIAGESDFGLQVAGQVTAARRRHSPPR